MDHVVHLLWASIILAERVKIKWRYRVQNIGWQGWMISECAFAANLPAHSRENQSSSLVSPT